MEFDALAAVDCLEPGDRADEGRPASFAMTTAAISGSVGIPPLDQGMFKVQDPAPASPPCLRETCSSPALTITFGCAPG